MKKYRSGASPAFLDEIDIYESTDPVDADTVDNVPLIQLMDNTSVLKAKLDAIGLADMEDVQELAEDILRETMEEAESDSDARSATEEEIEDVISDLDDL